MVEGRHMSYQESGQDTTDSIMIKENKVQNVVSIGQFIWTVIIGAGVFFTTLWTTQSVASTRIDQLEKEIIELKKSDEKIVATLATTESNNRTLLMDISTRLREIELKMTELQTRLLFAIEQKQSK
jgi:galactitol-specific phosphotransferase system IIC component